MICIRLTNGSHGRYIRIILHRLVLIHVTLLHRVLCDLLLSGKCVRSFVCHPDLHNGCLTQVAAAVDPDDLLTKVTDDDKEEEVPKKSSPFRVPTTPIAKPARPPKIKDMCVVMKCAPVQSAYTSEYI